MRECVKTCNPGYYLSSNKKCLAGCTANLFRERNPSIGENGIAQGANNYFECTADKCATDTFFRIEVAGQDNICMDSCQALAANSYSLKASAVVTNNSFNMNRCVQTCEPTEVFIPDHNF
jgi:hypothetical protein